MGFDDLSAASSQREKPAGACTFVRGSRLAVSVMARRSTFSTRRDPEIAALKITELRESRAGRVGSGADASRRGDAHILMAQELGMLE